MEVLEMNKELPKITFDKEMLYNTLQGDIARRIMDQKKYAYNSDVSISIGDNTFDTIGCESASDFLDKYSEELDKIGIKLFTIEQLGTENNYKITADTGETKIIMTTENCTNSIEFKEKNQAKLNQIPTAIALQILNEIDKRLDRENINGNEEPEILPQHVLLQRLEELEQKKKILDRRIMLLERIKLGTLSLVDNKAMATLSFDERKRVLEVQNKFESTEYMELLKLEQETVEATEEKIIQTFAELVPIEQEIAQVSVEIEKMKNNSNEKPNEAQNLPGSSSLYDMLPKKELEEDYYKRLENAAAEGPIFHDSEIDFNLQKVDKKPHIIKKVSKASARLINKIRNFKFSEWIAPAFNFMKKYKMAIAITTLTITSATLGFVGGKHSEIAKNQETSEIVTDIEENSIPETTVTEEKNVSEIAGTQPDISIENIVQESTEEENFNSELEEALNNILEGNAKVYFSSDRAINDINGKLPTEKQLENSWENATPGAYYTLENNQLEKITKEEATDYWQDGGTVAVRMDNNGTPIGWVPVEGQEDISVKGK